MQEQTKPEIRRRVNVETTSKGVKHASATFEATNLTKDEYEEQCTEFMAWVEANWPSPVTLNA